MSLRYSADGERDAATRASRTFFDLSAVPAHQFEATAGSPVDSDMRLHRRNRHRDRDRPVTVDGTDPAGKLEEVARRPSGRRHTVPGTRTPGASR